MLCGEVTMRICSIVLCAVLCTASSVMAQQAVFGLKAGINLANVNFDPQPDEDVSGRRTGFVGGLFVVVPVTELIAFQGEALFSQKGTSFDADGDEGSLELDYLEVPLLLRVGTASSGRTSFHAFAGPAIGLKLRSKFSATFEGETEDEDIEDDIEAFDIGLVGGAGVDFGRFTLDGRYTWGLRNVLNVDPDEARIKNRAFSIMAGVRF